MDRIGVGFWGGMSVNDLIDCVSLADQKGYESAYLIESFADAFGSCLRARVKLPLSLLRQAWLPFLRATRQLLPPQPRLWMPFQKAAFD